MEREKPLERELLLFKDSENCLSGSGIASNAKEESQTDLHLLLQLEFGATITGDPAGLIGRVSDMHLLGTLEMFTLVSAYGLFFEGDQWPGPCWSFCGKIAVCELRHWPIDLYFILRDCSKAQTIWETSEWQTNYKACMLVV
ncbi:hypothetical protein DVH24_011284 [Malus domestica]|uniref:Uncharacterized protein n=1 Tax=Malus domestica TaxID=3750 RepID=A0A498JSU3_MALDO|nr:hypothetical protein DVH24_011284 [Malus domestica]